MSPPGQMQKSLAPARAKHNSKPARYIAISWHDSARHPPHAKILGPVRSRSSGGRGSGRAAFSNARILT
jgi:hypothetical protein